MGWNSRNRPEIDASEKRSTAKGVFRKCEGCQNTFLSDVFANNFEVCPECKQHHKLSAQQWIKLLLDKDSFAPWHQDLVPEDPLQFNDDRSYRDRVSSAQRASSSKEAIEIGAAAIGNIPIAFGIFVYSFMGGSMGSVVGEKITILFEKALEMHCPVIMLHASGGARMQEGVLSLMQMAKSVAALGRYKSCNKPFISVCLNPTTGGVAASFALLGDINIAEEKALIGFAGPRVIESTIRQALPEGFQRAEFLLQHGLIDRVLSRLNMRKELIQLLQHLIPQTYGKP